MATLRRQEEYSHIQARKLLEGELSRWLLFAREDLRMAELALAEWRVHCK